jgi:arginine deiminase
MMSNEIKIHLQFDLTLLYFDDVITTEEHDRLVEIFKSPDNENHVLAVLAIETFKKRKRENQIANQKKAG